MVDKIQALESKNNRELREVKKKKTLHEKLEAQYQSEVLLPSLEEKKKRLREIREISRGFSTQEIDEHEKQYLKRRHNSSYFKPSRISEEWIYKPPEKT